MMKLWLRRKSREVGEAHAMLCAKSSVRRIGAYCDVYEMEDPRLLLKWLKDRTSEGELRLMRRELFRRVRELFVLW